MLKSPNGPCRSGSQAFLEMGSSGLLPSGTLHRWQECKIEDSGELELEKPFKDTLGV